jgi:signal peptidase I
MGKSPTKRTSKKAGTARKRRTPRRGRGKKPVTREYVEAILLAVALALFLRTFVVQAFRIPSSSMEDTLLAGDFLLASKVHYGAQIPFTDWRLPGFTTPAVGDVVIFQYPLDPERDFIKRCLGVAGQTVEIRNKALYIDGLRAVDPPRSKYSDPIIIPRESPNGVRDNFGPVAIPAGHLFVVGDNRDNSEDSRFWGFLPMKLVKAKATILYWSWAPDPRSPDYTGITSIPGIMAYSLPRFFERVRWSRICNWVQ